MTIDNDDDPYFFLVRKATQIFSEHLYKAKFNKKTRRDEHGIRMAMEQAAAAARADPRQVIFTTAEISLVFYCNGYYY